MKKVKVITSDEELFSKIDQGVDKVLKVAVSAYGPTSSNVLLEQNYSNPLISHDGVTNLDALHLEDPVQNAAARIIIQASAKTDKIAGDGTSASAILACYLYKEARRMVGAGQNRMIVSRKLQETAQQVMKSLDQYIRPVHKSLLKSVATISAGDEAVGEMIADVINEVGESAAITIDDFAGSGIYSEIKDGFYWRKGFTNINLINDPSNLESNLSNVNVFITDRTFKTAAEIYPVLDKMVSLLGKGKEVLFVGEFADEVLAALILNKANQVIFPTVVDTPMYGPLRTMFLDDLAKVTGAKVLAQGTNPKDFDPAMLGGADKVIINEFSTTIMGGDGSTEDVQKLIADLKDQLAAADAPVTQNAIRDRISRLTGKIAIIRVGGAVEADQGETKLRVRDAVCAVQAAIKGGIVPGGGTTLARIGNTVTDFGNAYKEPFKQLVINAGENPEAYLAKILDKKDVWSGYNLRDDRKQITNLLEAGVIDPADVIKEVVINSASVVSKLITTTVALTYANRDEKFA